MITATDEKRPWDVHFQQWLDEAAGTCRDPNDVGDAQWANDPLRTALERYYLPNIRDDSVVLELGPGTGRATRHVISRCRHMVLVDYSSLVCQWLDTYLQGKGSYEIHLIDKPRFASVADASIDMAFANGVFEHLDPEEALWFLEEFSRVLRVGGVVAFNFDNIMTSEGMAWLKRFRERPGARCIFRFYHPEMMAELARAAGLTVVALDCDSSRFAFVVFRKD